MSLTADQYQALIPGDLGLADNSTVIGLVPTWWDLESAFSSNLNLQYLYAKLRGVRWLLGQNWGFDWTEGDVSRKLSQIVPSLIRLRDELKQEIMDTQNDAANGGFGSEIIPRYSEEDPHLPLSYPYSLFDPTRPPCR